MIKFIGTPISCEFINKNTVLYGVTNPNRLEIYEDEIKISELDLLIHIPVKCKIVGNKVLVTTRTRVFVFEITKLFQLVLIYESSVFEVDTIHATISDKYLLIANDNSLNIMKCTKNGYSDHNALHYDYIINGIELFDTKFLVTTDYYIYYHDIFEGKIIKKYHISEFKTAVLFTHAKFGESISKFYIIFKHDEQKSTLYVFDNMTKIEQITLEVDIHEMSSFNNYIYIKSTDLLYIYDINRYKLTAKTINIENLKCFTIYSSCDELLTIKKCIICSGNTSETYHKYFMGHLGFIILLAAMVLYIILYLRGY
jgi:hypothetical protein